MNTWRTTRWLEQDGKKGRQGWWENTDKRIMTSFPQHHCSAMSSTASKGELQVVHVRRVQRTTIFTSQISHYKIKIMSKYLRFGEEYQIRHEFTKEVLDREDVSAETFTIPGEGKESG